MTDKNTFLVADIGGTNARLAIVSIPDFTLSEQHTFKCAEFDSLSKVVEAWQQASTTQIPERACFAIAGPIHGSSDNGSVKMTNLSWEFNIAELRKQLGLKELHVINDFAAMANAAAVLHGDNLVPLKTGAPVENSALCIIGPGTGFGAAALIPHQNKWITLPSEGGHAAFAPTTEIERDLLFLLGQKYPHVSIETLLCGRGLVDIYSALAQLQDITASDLNASDITQRALADSDELCVRSVETFCAILGSVAADKALTYGARGGVFIGGGIVPRLLGFIEKTNFIAHFTNKGVMSHYVEAIPVHIMTAEQPALIGAGAWLLNNQQGSEHSL